MRKAILYLTFAVALLGQPTDVQVDLSVVSVDSGSGEVCFKAILTTTGLLPTPPEFAYDYDWENDATYDLTDAGDSVCHTYTPGDSLWAKVQATTPTYEAEDSAEVIVPEGEEDYTFELITFSEPDIDISWFAESYIVIDEDSIPWVEGIIWKWDTVGNEYDPYSARMDTAGNYHLTNDILYWSHFNDHHITQPQYSINGIDTVYFVGEDTSWFEEISKRSHDSTLVRAVYYDYPDWFADSKVYRVIKIGQCGEVLVEMNRTEENDSLYPAWNHAIIKDGEVISRIDIPRSASIATNRISSDDCQITNGVFAIVDRDTIKVFESSGFELYRCLRTDHRYLYGSNNNLGYKLLSDSSCVYLHGLNIVKRKSHRMDYSFVLPEEFHFDTTSMYFHVENNYLFLKFFILAPWDNSNPLSRFTSYLYYFDISDSLELLWHDTMNVDIDYAGILPDGNPYIVALEIDNPWTGWKIHVISREDGHIISSFPDELQLSGTPFIVSNSKYLYYNSGPPFDESPLPEEGLIIIERRW